MTQALEWGGRRLTKRSRLVPLHQIVLTIGQVLNRDSYLFNSDGFKLESLMRVRPFPNTHLGWCRDLVAC
jgi:hypothetical protein